MKVSSPRLFNAVVLVVGCLSTLQVKGYRPRRLTSIAAGHGHLASQMLLDEMNGVKTFPRGPYAQMLIQQDPHGFLKQQGDEMSATIHDQIDPVLSSKRNPDPQDKDQQHRQLQDEELCDTFSLLFGVCTQEEFCQALETILEAQAPGFDFETTCEGDIVSGNFTLSLTGEICFYISEGEVGPFDATKFDAEKDNFCVFAETTAQSVQEVSTETNTYSYSRGGPNIVFSTASTTQPCDLVNPDAGDCTECTAATLNGQACASCVACDEFSSNSDFEYSCAAIDPAFVSTCLDDDDAALRNFMAGSGAFCFWEDILTGDCALQELCNSAKAASALGGEDFDCIATGSPAGEWTIEIMYAETCIYNATTDDGYYGEDYYTDYDPDTFDPDQDFCYMEKEVIKGSMATVTGVGFTYMLTRPVNGLFEDSTSVVPCTDQTRPDDDNIFLPTFCEDTACPEVKINGVLCTSDCGTCTEFDETFITWSCTNLDPSLVEECGSEVDFLEDTLVEYFKANPLSASPTKAPTAGTMAPTKTPTAGTMAPTKAPADGTTTVAPSTTPSAATGTLVATTKWLILTSATAAVFGLSVF